MQSVVESVGAAAASDIVVVTDSMKMELRVTAPCEGVLRGLGVGVDAMVERGHLMAEVMEESAGSFIGR